MTDVDDEALAVSAVLRRCQRAALVSLAVALACVALTGLLAWRHVALLGEARGTLERARRDVPAVTTAVRPFASAPWLSARRLP